MPVVNDRVALIGSERHITKGQSLIGPADSHEKVTVTVQVRRNPGAPQTPDLEETGRQRPSRRTPADRKAVMAALGADPKDLEQVKQFAQSHKLKAEHAEPAQRTIRLTGTVQQLNQAFGVQLKQYREGERTFRSRQAAGKIAR